MASVDPLDRWADVHYVLKRDTPFAGEMFEPGDDTVDFVASMAKVCVIGAGGLGCELLKNLALSGVGEIHVIDMDTIELTNLNRQFLFREKDIGSNKCDTAANFVNNRVAGANVISHFGKIQEFSDDFYMGFDCVVCGLDSVPARRWMNEKLCSLVRLGADDQVEPDRVIPLIDGGSEAFMGQARIILAGQTACYECSLDTLDQTDTKPHLSCTIAATPRNATHCVQYALLVEWPKHFEREPDKDDPQDVAWLVSKGRERARAFEIDEKTVDEQMAASVVKHIIPAIASTNAIIAAISTNEVLKTLSRCSTHISDYLYYNGGVGVNSMTLAYQPRDDCLVCRQFTRPKFILEMTREATLQEFIDRVAVEGPKVPNASVSYTTPLYTRAPPVLEESSRPNLSKSMSELLNGERVSVFVNNQDGRSEVVNVKFI